MNAGHFAWHRGATAEVRLLPRLVLTLASRSIGPWPRFGAVLRALLAPAASIAPPRAGHRARRAALGYPRGPATPPGSRPRRDGNCDCVPWRW
jgi:hypothetical protein